MEDKNFLGNPVEWYWTMRKITTPLGMSAFPFGMKFAAGEWEHPQEVSLAYWYYFEDCYADIQEVATIEGWVRDLIAKDSSYPERMAEAVHGLAAEINAQQITFDAATSTKELLEQFSKESTPFFRMVERLSFRGPIPIADTLSEMILSAIKDDVSDQEKQEIREAIQTPTKGSVVQEEHDFIVRNQARLATEQESVLQEYRGKFESLQFHWFVGEPLKDSDIQERFSQESNSAVAHVSVDLSRYFDEATLLLVDQLREWIYLRTYIKDMVNLAAYKLLPLLSAIAAKKGLEVFHLAHLTFEELYTLEDMSAEDVREKFLSRKNGYSGKTAGGPLEIGDFGEPSSIDLSQDSLKGNIAYKGQVTGKVKVMLSPREDFGDADILVVGMTTPDYLPAMKRARAFVTDEGGITCHAAIIAREMKKPCVIGTKIATKLFKDGDVVEVDAEQGLVRKVS